MNIEITGGQNGQAMDGIRAVLVSQLVDDGAVQTEKDGVFFEKICQIVRNIVLKAVNILLRGYDQADAEQSDGHLIAALQMVKTIADGPHTYNDFAVLCKKGLFDADEERIEKLLTVRNMFRNMPGQYADDYGVLCESNVVYRKGTEFQNG